MSDYKIEFNSEVIDIENGNIDVFVTFSNGNRYTATFFTLGNIQRIMKGYKKSGECFNGKYFWASDMIIVENLNPLTIRESIEDIVKSEDIESCFHSIQSS